jgi:hypothetical protein
MGQIYRRHDDLDRPQLRLQTLYSVAQACILWSKLDVSLQHCKCSKKNTYLREEKVNDKDHHDASTNENNVEPVADIRKGRGGNRCPENGAKKKALHGESNTLSPEFGGENL